MAQHYLPDEHFMVHPTRVVSLREAILFEFEWFGDGDLYSFIHSEYVTNLNLVHAILKYTARCLHYVHKNHRVHLDIKPENILLSGDQTRLCDLEFSNSECHSASVAPRYTYHTTLHIQSGMNGLTSPTESVHAVWTCMHLAKQC